MSIEKNLKEILDEILDEVQKELDEATTTGNVDGYQTPYAFSKGNKHKKRKKKIATQLGYSVVGNDIDNINEAKYKVGDTITVIRKDGMKYKGKVEKLNPLKLRTDSTSTVVLPNPTIKKVVKESVNEGYGDWVKAKNLNDIIKLSKQKKNATFYVTDDNNSRIGTFYLKNGKFAKATTANPNYDLQRNKTKLKDRSDVIYKYKVDESVNEGKFKPSQVRSAISRVKKALMRKWKQKGGYENFGQKELRQLQNKFDYNAYGDKDEREISHMLDAFDNWAMNYDGSMRESVNEKADPKKFRKGFVRGDVIVNDDNSRYVIVAQRGKQFIVGDNGERRESLPGGKVGKKKLKGNLSLKDVLGESVNEAKVKRPINRWLELKNDETMHPHKKMAMGLKELKYQLREVEKFFNWYNKIKTINELDSDKYWKRTNRHIYTIKEKLIKIAKTIQEIEK